MYVEKNKMAIKVIFFDFGGVLVEHVFDNVINELKKIYRIDKYNRQKIFDILINDDFQIGKINNKDVLKQLKDTIDIPIEINKFNEIVKKALMNKIDPVWEKIENIYKDYHVSIISDMPNDWVIIIRKNYDLSFFKRPIFSSEVGFTKKDERIFEYALKTHGIEGNEAVYIDDHKEYLKIAEKCGMNVILFENYKQLSSDLKAFNVVLYKA